MIHVGFKKSNSDQIRVAAECFEKTDIKVHIFNNNQQSKTTLTFKKSATLFCLLLLDLKLL